MVYRSLNGLAPRSVEIMEGRERSVPSGQACRLIFLVFSILIPVCVRGVDPNTATGCFVHTAMKFRAYKDGCRPLDLSINGCWGRCDSYQIPELMPPYVYSVHPCCIHDDYTLVTIPLPDCDSGVDPSFTYRDANGCV
ncbi:glycoprotein hormone beta-5-like [Apostichopus japonicus]|uniref:glycoprotein hormone beta-5-like n=1 Tax=Stichopus japonicus TaxID=307972 RepID=UPI003AB8C7C3